MASISFGIPSLNSPPPSPSIPAIDGPLEVHVDPSIDGSEQIRWTKVVKVIQICLMLCTYGLLLHFVGKRQPSVYLGASYGNGKLGDSFRESFALEALVLLCPSEALNISQAGRGVKASPGRLPPTVRVAFPARLNWEQRTWVSGHKAC